MITIPNRVGSREVGENEGEKLVSSEIAIGEVNHNPSGILHQAEMALAAGRLSETETLCRDLLTRAPETAGGWALLSELAERSGDLDYATDLMDQAVNLDPQNGSYWQTLGELRRNRANVPGAMVAFRKAVELQPENSLNWFRLAVAHAEANETTRAEKAYRKAMQYSKESAKTAEIRVSFAWFLRNGERMNPAIKQLEQAILEIPESAALKQLLENFILEEICSRKSILTRVRQILPSLWKQTVPWLDRLNIGVLRRLERLVRIRFLYFEGNSIGHLANHLETFACEVSFDQNLLRRSDILIVCLVKGAKYPIANEQLAHMVRRYLKRRCAWAFFPSPDCFFRMLELNRMSAGWEAFEVTPNTHAYGRPGLLHKFAPHLTFTRSEMSRGRTALQTMGVGQNDRFVCLLVRDHTFHPTEDPDNIRNVDCDDFSEAILALAERGLFVIRMGAKVNRKLKVTHPRVIDYATNGMRTDFMDVYLGAHCHFTLSTAAGWDEIPAIFQRPFIWSSFAEPWILPAYAPLSMTILKRYRRTDTGRELMLSEIMQLLMPADGMAQRSTKALNELGIEVVDNFPAELKSVALEMADRLDGKWVGTPEDAAMQDAFWRSYYQTQQCLPPAFRFSQSMPDMPVTARGEKARIGTEYLRKNMSWMRC